MQIFGVKKSADTRKALRFFSERRVKTHFVDLDERAASMGELRRFVQKFGLVTLIDRDSKRVAQLGLAHARLSDDRWMEKLDVEFPGYCFARHKGYGTAVHRTALESLGTCGHHRKSFNPIKLLMEIMDGNCMPPRRGGIQFTSNIYIILARSRLPC